jgi:hypothetical protein
MGMKNMGKHLPLNMKLRPLSSSPHSITGNSMECISAIHTNVSSCKHTKITAQNQIEVNQQIKAKNSRAGSCKPRMYRGSILTSKQPHELCNLLPLLVGPPLPLPHLPSQCLLALIQVPTGQLRRHPQLSPAPAPWPVAHHPEQARPSQSAAVEDVVEWQHGLE